MLRCIGYVSSAKSEFSVAELEVFVGSWVPNNAASNITGILCYDSGNIVQFIEGEDAAVTALFEKISGDIRHFGVIEVFNEEIEARVFPNWSMAIRHVADLPAGLRAGCRNLMKTNVPHEGGDNPHRQIVEDLLYAFKQSIR